MNHFCDLSFPKEHLAVITPYGDRITYGILSSLCDKFAVNLDGPGKQLVIILCTNTYEALCGYLACLRSNHVPLLLDARIEKELLDTLIEKYQPDYIWAPNPSDQSVFSIGSYYLQKLNNGERKIPLHKDLGLLLSTSGSTGSPKLVRLTKENLQVNADSICEYLGITAEERPITILPMQYTYGLSIINSHLNHGATILMTDTSIMQSSFWEFAKENGVTSLCGVPYTYQMYKRLKLFQMDIPTLRTMTQAGGKLPAELGNEFSRYCTDKGIRFFIMYGQTEATARMSYLPPDRNLEKYTSIGIAIPGGKFSIIDDNGDIVTEPEVTGELVYEGKNVMMGYAESAADLSKGHEMESKLITGDMAKFDSEGYYYIVGRKKRFIKLFGNRVNLDEIEQYLKTKGYNCACVGVDDKMRVFVTQTGLEHEIKNILSQITHINGVAFEIRYIAEIPLNDAGKTLYSKLNEVK